MRATDRTGKNINDSWATICRPFHGLANSISFRSWG